MNNIAVFNAGSSSIKFAIFDQNDPDGILFKGAVENIGVAPRLKVDDGGGGVLAEQEWGAKEIDHSKATTIILETAIGLLGGRSIPAIGHRVVHGGTEFAAPVVVDAGVIAALDKLTPLAPLHQPHNLTPIRTIAKAAPHILQVACFDTAFHQSQRPIAQTYAIPRELTESGIRRYGFHGLSYEFVSGRMTTIAPDHADKRLIIAHLGNGASLCAIHEGRSVATTMGFTAVEGLMMGTRCGSIDPGVIIYLIDNHGMDARAIENLIYKKSGLLGVSGISSDMRALLDSKEPAAAEAVNLFVYRIIREIGSLAAALGGIDGLVFTGGIGERSSAIRRNVVAGCGWLGAELDEAANAEHRQRVDSASSRLPIWVVPTDEERVMARHTSALLHEAAPNMKVMQGTQTAV